MKTVVAIVGPTAVGKSKLAISIAQRFDGEIVNADSRQVYRYMDIGTAKPSPDDREIVPHHLIDIIAPDESFSVALYQELAYRAIEDIQHRGKLPLLVGGSGLYLWAVVEGWQIPQVPPDPEFRHSLSERAAREGSQVLYEELRRVDPMTAEKMDQRNVRRVIRALEIHRATGLPFSQFQQKRSPPFQTILIGLTTDREELYRIIDSRVDSMLNQGLAEEVQSLIERGYSTDLPSMITLSYKQIGLYLQGKEDLPTAIQQIKFETHRFARHQYAWFHLDDSRIHWFDIKEAIEPAILDLIESSTGIQPSK
jgi:tRNA dimethylallyltransferase